MIKKIAEAILHAEFSLLYYHLWLRLHRLDHSQANLVKESDGQPYSNSGGPNLEKVLKELSIKKDGSTLLEYGVGKGIAVITLSKYFDSIIGVDLSQELIKIAEKNLKKMKISNVQLYCEDARTFSTGLDDVTHIYLFNSFAKSVTIRVVQNIKRSLERKPRPFTVIYKAPYAHEDWVNAGFTHNRDLNFTREKPFQDCFSIYKI